MQHQWTHLTGATVAGKYVLGSFLGERRRSGVFDASADNGATSVRVSLIPAHTKHAEIQQHAWSLATQLAHPGLLRVLESGTDDIDGVVYVFGITERPEDTVADVLPERPLDANEVRQVLEAIVPALAHLHKHGSVHGFVEPASIVAVDRVVKLTSDSLTPAAETGAIGYDLRSLGTTIVEMLTSARPVAYQGRVDPAVTSNLPAPFGAIAAGLLERDTNRQWTLAQVQDALADTSAKKVAEPVRGPVRRSSVYPAPAARKWAIPAAVGTAALALITIPLLLRHEPQPQAASPAPAAVTVPAPVTTPTPAPVTTPAPAAVTERARIEPQSERPSPMPVLKKSGDWAVVAAIYRDYDAAANRARTIAQQWRRTNVEVFPPEGQGRRYMVVLASGLSRDDAERVQRQAQSAGLPRDTYVTRLSQ